MALEKWVSRAPSDLPFIIYLSRLTAVHVVLDQSLYRPLVPIMKIVSQMFDSPSAHSSRFVDNSSTCATDSLKVSEPNVNHQIVEASNTPPSKKRRRGYRKDFRPRRRERFAQRFKSQHNISIDKLSTTLS